MASMERRGSDRMATDTKKGVKWIQFCILGLTSDRERAGDTRTHWVGYIMQQQGHEAMQQPQGGRKKGRRAWQGQGPAQELEGRVNGGREEVMMEGVRTMDEPQRITALIWLSSERGRQSVPNSPRIERFRPVDREQRGGQGWRQHRRIANEPRHESWHIGGRK